MFFPWDFGHFLKFCESLRVNFVEAEWFSNFILFCIIMAGVMVGIIVGYPQMADDPSANSVDTIISFIFLLEVIVKMVSEGEAVSYSIYG